MFGKLLKNDLKAQWHSMSTIFLCTFIVAIAAELVTLTTDSKPFSIVGGMIVFIAMGFACIVVMIAAAMIFSQTMFGRAGYLTLSLPVKTTTLLKSKTISALIWIFSVYALFMGSLFLWIYQVQKTLGDEMMESVESLLSIFGVPSFLTISVGVVFFCISLAVIVLVIVQALHLGITCSHIPPVSKFGNIGAIVIFFGAFLAIQSVTNAISDAIPFGLVITSDTLKITGDIVTAKAMAGGGAMSIGVVGTILRLVFAIALHYPTTYLIKHKISIK